jgi:hypothetical protein
VGFNENVDLLSELTWTPRQRKGNTGRLDNDGLVEPNPTIDLDTGFIWVRIKGERTAMAVMNINVRTDRANIPVIIEELAPDIWQVKQVDAEDAIFTYGGDVAADFNRPNRIAELDKSPVAHKRLKDLRLRLSTTGGLVLYVDAGVYQKVNGDLVYWGGGTIDVTASVPAGIDTKRIVLIGINTTTNALAQSAATAVSVSATPTQEPFFTVTDMATARNAAASGTLWLWAFGLFYGETVINNTDRFVDLRAIAYEEPTVYTVTASSPLASSGGSAPNISLTGIVPIANGGTGASTAITAFNALSPLTSKGDIVTNDATNDIRLAVGTNGYTLRPNSAVSAGLEWSIIGATFEATLATTDATVTPLISYTVAELIGVTLQGRIIAVKTDRTAAYGASFRVSFRRATAGNVALVGVGYVEADEDSGGAPVVTFNVNVGSQVGIVEWAGVIAENWSVKCHYTVTSL